jgi:hypothetical protein
MSSLSLEGKLPLVSSFTKKPSDFILAINSAISCCKRGSPPDTQMPSKNPFRLARKSKKASSDMYGDFSTSKTMEALWQNGQRKLHPPVNTVAAIFPG